MDVFEAIAGTGFSFNAMRLRLKQIKKQIEELAQKAYKLLIYECYWNKWMMEMEDAFVKF